MEERILFGILSGIEKYVYSEIVFRLLFSFIILNIVHLMICPANFYLSQLIVLFELMFISVRKYMKHKFILNCKSLIFSNL